jgi:hypothetical protein
MAMDLFDVACWWGSGISGGISSRNVCRNFYQLPNCGLRVVISFLVPDIDMQYVFKCRKQCKLLELDIRSVREDII